MRDSAVKLKLMSEVLVWSSSSGGPSAPRLMMKSWKVDTNGTSSPSISMNSLPSGTGNGRDGAETGAQVRSHGDCAIKFTDYGKVENLWINFRCNHFSLN